MKILAAVALIVVSPIPFVLLTLAAIAADPPPGAASILLLTIGGALLMIVPILMGAVAADRRVDLRTTEGRAQHPALVLTYSALGVVGVLAVIASGLVGRIAPWIPIVALLVEAALAFAATAVGDRLRRRGKVVRKGRPPAGQSSAD